ncbi:pyridoxamine 5'-phosphate oxidase-like FMN-binding protein [Rhodococcus wratislaviensis IFP 2016]|nr:pyridoxamine 5'-phosphate oxidase-like FMN-binding protein [Rhodococcus wratislaviensis IFP 2016]
MTVTCNEPYVITPIHPGFEGQPRPDWFDSVPDLALAYLDLLDALDLREVLVIGRSIGGWTAPQMALRDTRRRIGGLVLLNAVGIRANDPDEITDPATHTPTELGRLTFHNPALVPDPAPPSDEQQAAMTATQSALAVYASTFTKDGRPKPTAIWAAPDGDRLLVITEEDSFTVKRIRNTPRVTLAVCDMRGNPESEAVDATASILDKSETENVYRPIGKRYGIVGKVFTLFSKLRDGSDKNVGLAPKAA